VKNARSGENVRTPVTVYYVRHRYGHHAGPTGYDRICDYVGEAVPLSPPVGFLGETILRLPAKLISWYGGSYEYSRHDCVMECQAALHMLRRHGAIYHFIYGEKSYKLLGPLNGFHGHRLVATIHHPPEHFPALFRSTKHFKRLTHLTAVSRNQVPFLADMVGPDRVTFVPYGVDTTYFAPSTEPLSTAQRCLFVGFHERDFDSLPAVVDGILRRHNRAEFWMVCGDPRCGNVRCDDRVKWLQHIPDSTYLDLLRSASLLVLPMKLSTTNSAVLEALSCGVPVVTSEGGIRDYLDPSCSVMLPVGDVDGMVNAAVELLQDDARRTAMARAARVQAECFAWPRIAEQMAAVYRQIVDQT
jgi:glycosyltransferase involved in cell wall biosynthesis